MLPIDVAPLIDEFNVGPLTVERRAAPVANATGGYDAQAPSLVVFDPIAAHTVDGRDVMQGPEADRNAETTRFYARARLYAADDGFARDVVLYRGRRWRITKVEDNDLQGAVYMADAVLEEVQVIP